MGVRLTTAIFAGKAAYFIGKLSGGRGSSLPGAVALRIFPGTLRALADQITYGTIMVTGTNGKTTTNNMLARVLESFDDRLVINREGANLINGVTTAFLKKSSLRGRLAHHWALLEADEAAFPKIADIVQPKVVIVTNFFRDQLDRYGELDKTVSLIRTALAKLSSAKLVLNADDPLVAQLADTGLPRVFYGVGAPTRNGEAGSVTREARFCPYCGENLSYRYYHYSQLGAYRCGGCGFVRPRVEVEALGAEVIDGVTRCKVRVEKKVLPVTLPTQGFYNVYNALAVFAAGLLLGIAPETTAGSLSRYVPATGRLQQFNYKGRPIYLNLVKNPAGFNESLNLLCGTRETKDVLIALNDNSADGRDVSWIWDVDFERLQERRDILRFVCSGRRSEEMALRLKYAGVPVQRITVCPGFAASVRQVLEGHGGVAYLLATYTALWPVEKILRRYARESTVADRLPSLSQSS
ncbi:MAG: MurT ligase domain-containing protein [Bacillota bacterium]